MSDQPQHVIVFESQPFWEPELQRQFLGEDVRVGACRSVSDLHRRVVAGTYDVCVIDLSADVTGLLRWLGKLQVYAFTPAVIAIASEAQKSLEWHVRELGAVAFVDEYVGGKKLAAMCRKQWDELRAGAALRRRSFKHTARHMGN